MEHKAKPKNDSHDQERIDAAIAKRDLRKRKRALVAWTQALRRISP